MSGIFRLLMSLVVIVGSIGFIIYQISYFLLNIGSVKRRVRKDFVKLGQMVSEYTDALIPMSIEELKLLSAQPIARMKRRSRYATSKGYLSTIYQEPLFAFAIKKYHKSGRVIMMVRSDDTEYRFYREKHQTRLYKNEIYKGYISENDRLYTHEDLELARIENSGGMSYTAIYTGEHDMAHLNKTHPTEAGMNDRAFSLFHDFDTEKKDELIYLALYQFLFKPNLHL